jgi:hypothetical protein
LNIDAFIYLEKLRSLVQPLPGVTEASCYGTPGFYVNKKLFARLKEDGETLVIYTEERDKWMKKAPSIYFITDHYLNYPTMLIRLSKSGQKELQALLVASWKMRAPQRLIKEYDENSTGGPADL